MRRVILLLVVAILVTYSPTRLHAPQPIYITEGNIFDGVFVKVVETIYFVFFNGDILSFSTHDAYMVDLSAHWYKTYLESKGRELREVAIVMHNHFGFPRLSNGDRHVLMMFRNYGFRGSFCILDTAVDTKICEPPWLRGVNNDRQ